MGKRLTDWEARLHSEPRPRQRTCAERWREHVQSWRTSGLSQAAYCRRHKLHPITFNHWKRKADACGWSKAVAPRKRSVVTHTPGFLPLVVRPGASPADGERGGWWAEVACANGRVLRLAERIAGDELRSLVTAVEG